MVWVVVVISSSKKIQFNRSNFSFLIMIIVMLLVAVTRIHASDLPFPKLTGRVVDNAYLLSDDVENKLTVLLKVHEDTTSNQVVVVTLNTLQGQTIEDFGYQLGRHWGIGQKKKNNGVLLIVAPRERKVRIEVGYGLEGTLTDAISKSIIDTVILPKFKSKNMSGGIVAGVNAMLPVLEGAEYRSTPKGFQFFTSINIGLIIHIILFLSVVILIAYFVLSEQLNSWEKFNRRDHIRDHRFNRRNDGYLNSGGHHGSSGRSGGFGGGGFSGGGGGFGGGGSSGGW
ncbi:MAG: TPM domain-containing protein [Planctomycetes bacterium]|nr:TPM domain-containing protein [Planctomycetota bacterium]